MTSEIRTIGRRIEMSQNSCNGGHQYVMAEIVDNFVLMKCKICKRIYFDFSYYRPSKSKIGMSEQDAGLHQKEEEKKIAGMPESRR